MVNIDPNLGYDIEDVGNGCYTNRWKPVSAKELQAALKFFKRYAPDINVLEVPNPVQGPTETVAGGKHLPLNLELSRQNPDGTITSEKFDATAFVRQFPITWCGVCQIFYEGSGANVWVELPLFKG
jgi:hypothetical protein